MRFSAVSLVALLNATRWFFSKAAEPEVGETIRMTTFTNGDQQEPSIAINPTNPNNLVAGSIDSSRCAAYYSTDRGATWTPSLLSLAPGFTLSGDPVVDFAADGTAYYLCMNTANSNALRGQYVYTSTDGGQTWSAPVLAIAQGNNDADDKGHIIVDNNPESPYLGNVYVAATRLTDVPRKLHFARSTTQGASFTSNQVLDGEFTSFAVNMAVGADGTLYAAWSRENDSFNPIQIMLGTSNDGGQSFNSPPAVIRNAGVVSGGVRPLPSRGNGFPYIATHPTNGKIVYAVWAEDPIGDDDSDIHFSRSIDGGIQWSSAVRINTDVNPPNEFFSQFWPTMSVDIITGDIDIIWYSDQNDPDRTDNIPLIDLYFTSSHDEGLNFDQPVRVTQTSSQPFGFFGDYLGIDSYDGETHPIWVDTTFTANNQDPATTVIGSCNDARCGCYSQCGRWFGIEWSRMHFTFPFLPSICLLELCLPEFFFIFSCGPCN